MNGTYGREKGWNGSFRDGWNFIGGKRVVRNSKEDGGGPEGGTVL